MVFGRSKKFSTDGGCIKYLDPDVEVIADWKSDYLRECSVIERYACGCLDLILPKSDDVDPGSFKDYIASLST